MTKLFSCSESYLSDRKRITDILVLAVPASVEYMFQTAVGFVDTIFVAKLGLNEVAAVGITNTILDLYIAIFMAIGIASSSMIARNIGIAGRKAGEIVRQSTLLALLAGMLCGLLTFFWGDRLLGIMGAETKVLNDASVYFRIVGSNSVFISLMFVLGSILRGSGNTLLPMKISIWINVLHVMLDYMLIFGFINIPGFGIVGAAWATVVVRGMGSMALLIAILRLKIGFPIPEYGTLKNWNWTISKELILLSLPAAIEKLLMRAGQVLYIGLIISMGTYTYTAHIIAGNLEMFAFMPAYGLSVAATTLVGQCVGNKKSTESYRYGILAAIIGVLIMSCISLVIFFACPWFASWFTQEKEVLELVIIALKIDALVIPALTLAFVFSGALQGAGDTKTPMYSTVAGMWIVRVIGVYVLGIRLGMGLAGVYLSAAIDMFLRALFLFRNFKSRLSPSSIH